MPTLIQLLGFDYNWPAEDIKFENRLARRQDYLTRNKEDILYTNNTFYDLLLKAVTEDAFAQLLFHHMNKLLIRVLNRNILFEADIRNSFIGKFNNLDGLNYLNPFGELSFMGYQMFDKENRIIELEYPFPNGKPKDFLIENKETKVQGLYEVLNIHCKTTDEADNFSIMEDIFEKIRTKIFSETKNLKGQMADLPKLSFVVILWHTSLVFLQQNISLFTKPNDIIISEISSDYPINGFYTYTKIGNELQFTNIYELWENV